MMSTLSAARKITLISCEPLEMCGSLDRMWQAERLARGGKDWAVIVRSVTGQDPARWSSSASGWINYSQICFEMQLRSIYLASLGSNLIGSDLRPTRKSIYTWCRPCSCSEEVGRHAFTLGVSRSACASATPYKDWSSLSNTRRH